MKTLFSILVLLVAARLGAQEIGGTIIDQRTKEPVINAAIQVYQNHVLKGGMISDFDGNYVIKSLDPGTYDVIVLYYGYDTSMITGVIVNPGQRTTVNFALHQHNMPAGTVALAPRRNCGLPPEPRPKFIIIPDSLASLPVVGPKPQTLEVPYVQGCYCRAEIVQAPSTSWFMPVTSLFDYIATVPGAYQRRRGDPVCLYGSRPDGVLYIIDGIYQ